jgi:hypothetical protein
LQQAQDIGTEDPEQHYITRELHAKLGVDLDYLRRRSLGYDLMIVGHTVMLMIGLGKRVPVPTPSTAPATMVAAQRPPGRPAADMPLRAVGNSAVTETAVVEPFARNRPRSS